LRTAAASGYSRLFDKLRTLAPDDLQEMDSAESVYGAVAAGRGWSTAVSSLRHGPPPGTIIKPTTSFSVSIPVVARWRADDDSRLTANAIALFQGIDPAPIRAHTLPHGAAHIEFRHLQAIVAASGEGSLSRAARRTRLTQSGIARRVQSIERAVGCRLLRRDGGAITLTRAGEVFCADAGRVLAMAAEAIAHTRRSHRGMTLVCRIAALPGELTDNLIVEPLRVLSRTHPEIAIEFHELMSISQRDALLRGEIDVALGGASPTLPEHPEMASAFVLDNPLECALVARAHPLAGRSSVTPADLAALPFLFVERTSNEDFYELVTRALSEYGLSPDPGGIFNGPRALWRIVADSQGWTIGPRSQRPHPPHGLVGIPIEGLSIPWGLQLLWRSQDANPSVQIVVDAIMAARRGA
jgi:DNA-binding transcriptional LysR family regulator